MEGVFLGWLPNRAFGFITPDDGNENVFVHKTTTGQPSLLEKGCKVIFDIENTPKGRTAVNVTPLITEDPKTKERFQGWVTYCNDKGYGFIEPNNRTPNIFVHFNNLRDKGYLCEGDIVEYSLVEDKNGQKASDVTIVGWTNPIDHLSAFADLGGPGWLNQLADIAEDEPWEYAQTTSSEQLPILRSYIKHTFRRLEEMKDGMSVNVNGNSSAFNTGLVTPYQEEIYALFRKNPRPGRQPWILHGFKKASDWDSINCFGSNPPPLASYFDDPSVLLYDRRCELFINIDHVMENLERFPVHLRSNAYVARQLLISAEATTKKRVYRNYKTAIPQFFRDKGGIGEVQLLLPICLENPAKADLALAVSKSEAGNAYRGSTILTLDMAYNNARLLARPDTEWLQP